MFQLSAEGFADLRLQSATSSAGHGGRRYAPLAFTEHGAIMASMVLNSERATALSVYVVRAFVELRALLASNKELAAKVNSLERKVSVHERSIGQLADAMSELLAAPASPPKRPIGFIHHEDKGASKKTSKAKGKTPRPRDRGKKQDLTPRPQETTSGDLRGVERVPARRYGPDVPSGEIRGPADTRGVARRSEN